MKLLYQISEKILVIVLLLCLSGCGTFTKMRYSRGYKSNIEFNFGKKKGKEERHIAAKAVKRQITSVSNPTPESISNDDLKIQEATIISQPKTKLSVSIISSQIKGKLSHISPLGIIEVHKAFRSKTERPIEPNTKWAQFIFYRGLVLLVISSIVLYTIGGGIGIELIIFWLALLGCIFSIVAGFILALIGAKKIIRSRTKLKGLGMDISIIFLFTLLFLILLLSLYFSFLTIITIMTLYVLLLSLYLIL